MKIKRAVSVLLVVCAMTALSGCDAFQKIAGGETTLRVGVENIAGNLNPFYCNSSADEAALAQIFQPIQYQTSGGRLTNCCGNITYEENGNAVKYTVSINNNLMFSDGTNVTIDDVIFFYYFIADALYDGKYADWYLNDIKGLKEYHFDDIDYSSALAEIEDKVARNYTPEAISEEDLAYYLTETEFEGEWNGNIDSDSPFGKSWRKYLSDSGFESDLESLVDSQPGEKLLAFAASAVARTNPSGYDCSGWWRNKLLSEYVSKNYSNGINVSKISGIKRINDYACTVEFNSHNLNAISSLNVPIVSKSYYSREYQKGKVSVVRELTGATTGCGPYTLRDIDKENSQLTLVRNPYYYAGKSGFDTLRFIDLASKGENPADAIANETVDIIEISAEGNIIDGFDTASTAVSAFERPYYSALFFNTKTVDAGTRCAISCLASCADILKKNIGSYYTLLSRSMSMRFYDAVPKNQKPYYSLDSGNIKALLAAEGYEFDAGGKCVRDNAPLQIKLYCSENNDSTETAVIDNFSASLKNNGIECVITRLPEQEFIAAVKGGKADMWFDRVYDGATADKYEYYHSNGSLNYTGISDTVLDKMLLDIRQNAGGTGYQQQQSIMLDTLAKLAVEIPLYQRKNVTVFNTKTIKADSIPPISRYSGMKYSICCLEPVLS